MYSAIEHLWIWRYINVVFYYYYYFIIYILVYSVQRSLDPGPARSLVGRHNSWLLLCSFSAQRYLGENGVVVGEWW